MEWIKQAEFPGFARSVGMIDKTDLPIFAIHGYKPKMPARWRKDDVAWILVLSWCLSHNNWKKLIDVSCFEESLIFQIYTFKFIEIMAEWATKITDGKLQLI